MVKSIDGAWGGKLNNGSFTGIIGMVERGDVEIGISAFSMTRDRAQAVDFLDVISHYTCEPISSM